MYKYTHLFIRDLQQPLEVCVIRSIFKNEKTVTKIDPRSFGWETTEAELDTASKLCVFTPELQ